MIHCKLAAFGGFAALAVLGAAGPAAAWQGQSFDTSASAASAAASGGGEAWFMVMAGHGGFGGGFGSGGFGHPPGPGSTPGPGGTAGPSSVLRDMPTSQADRGVLIPPVARYSAGLGVVFVLDRSSGVPLLKFEDSPEVWVLQPSPASRGDVIYKNDLGEPILRATRLGGLTLFSNAAPGGAAAALVGSADDLQPPPVLSPNMVFQRMLQASVRASHAAQHLITFGADDVTPDSAPLFVDAATVAAEAVVQLSRRDDGRIFLKRLDRMVFMARNQAGAAVVNTENGVHTRMQVFIDPGEGIAGRPSSEKLVKTALGK